MPEQKRIFDPKQLDNLRSLHDHEECLRKESLAMLAADSARAEMLFLVTNAMGILFGFIHDTKARSDDELTIQYLGNPFIQCCGSVDKACPEWIFATRIGSDPRRCRGCLLARLLSHVSG